MSVSHHDMKRIWKLELHENIQILSIQKQITKYYFSYKLYSIKLCIMYLNKIQSKFIQKKCLDKYLILTYHIANMRLKIWAVRNYCYACLESEQDISDCNVCLHSWIYFIALFSEHKSFLALFERAIHVPVTPFWKQQLKTGI